MFAHYTEYQHKRSLDVSIRVRLRVLLKLFESGYCVASGGCNEMCDSLDAEASPGVRMCRDTLWWSSCGGVDGACVVLPAF